MAGTRGLICDMRYVKVKVHVGIAASQQWTLWFCTRIAVIALHAWIAIPDSKIQ